MNKLEYKDDAEKEALKAQESAKGMVLSAELIHSDGKYLVFAEPKPLTLEERVAALEARISMMEKKP